MGVRLRRRQALIYFHCKAIFVYAQSFQTNEMLALGGNTSSSFFNVRLPLLEQCRAV